jgi:hypothetical protein
VSRRCALRGGAIVALAVVAVACGNGAQSASHGERRSTSTPGRRAVTPAPSTPASSAAHAPAPPGVPTPRPALTPGAVDPRVTQSNLGGTICRAGYTRTVRNVPQAIKNRVYKEYGITRHRAGEHEVDHLVSLELGGFQRHHEPLARAVQHCGRRAHQGSSRELAQERCL